MCGIVQEDIDVYKILSGPDQDVSLRDLREIFHACHDPQFLIQDDILTVEIFKRYRNRFDALQCAAVSKLCPFDRVEAVAFDSKLVFFSHG